MRTHRARVHVFVPMVMLCLALASPAFAQLNNQRIQQGMEGQIRNQPPSTGAPPPGSTQAKPAPLQTLTPVRVEGRVVSVQGDLVTLDQAVVAFGKTTTMRSRLCLTKDTKVTPPGWKPAAAARVKLVYVVEPGGRRRIVEIGP